MLPEKVQKKLAGLPATPGVYLFRGARKSALYVGKASSLRSRVRSYFQAGTGDNRYFIAQLADEIRDIETFVTANEKEAFLLENALIKEHRPRYNVKLKDDKEYLSLRLDEKKSWPRLELVRRPKKDGAHYFGPYDSATAARRTLRLINRHFQLRTCTDSEFKGRTRPCLQYQIKRCPGPCVLDTDEAAYGEQVSGVVQFLKGQYSALTRVLKKKMLAASKRQDYESAAAFRDQIEAIDRVQERQRITTDKMADQDVIGLFRDDDLGEMSVLRIRRGRVSGVRTFPLSNLRLPDSEVVASFVSSFYKNAIDIPDGILLDHEVEAISGLADWLSESKGKRVRVEQPQRGSKKRLLELAQENAKHAFAENARAQDDVAMQLETIQEKLRLPKLPRRIECIDVSHSSGTHTVAAITVLVDGEVATSEYRNYHVKTVSGGDDYGAMHEVLSRRFRRGKRDEAGWTLPDLMLVDGGRGQLGVAHAVLKDLAIDHVPIAAIAKEKLQSNATQVFDRIYLVGQKNPIVLKTQTKKMQLLAVVRDEAHRVSNLARIRAAKKKNFASELDAIAGIGAKTRTMLLKKFGSSAGVFAADSAALKKAGLNQSQISSIAGKHSQKKTGY